MDLAQLSSPESARYRICGLAVIAPLSKLLPAKVLPVQILPMQIILVRAQADKDHRQQRSIIMADRVR